MCNMCRARQAVVPSRVSRAQTRHEPDYDVCWSGTLYRQDEQRYSLLGDGWKIRGNITDHAPSAKRYDKSLPHPQDGGGGVQPAITNWPASHPQNRLTPTQARAARLERHRELVSSKPLPGLGQIRTRCIECGQKLSAGAQRARHARCWRCQQAA